MITQHSSKPLAIFLTALTLIAFVPTALRAQDAVAEQETLDLFVGDIFEILPSHDLPDPTYTWILTQDRNFIEAGRAETFRKRLITPGRYSLYGEISSNSDPSRHISRTFILNYKPRVPGQTTESSIDSNTPADALVRTDPAQDDSKRVILPSEKQLVKLDPLSPDVRPLVADIDVSKDSDGDGNPQNDIDTEQTFFQTDATPLYLWIADNTFTTRSISVTAAKPDGAQVQMIDILDETYAREQGLIQSPITVRITQTSGRTYSFTATLDEAAGGSIPLLYHWEFGDGQQSLLASPTHEYAAEGAYEVKLRIRNLTDGKDIAAYTESITVTTSAVVSSAPSSEDTNGIVDTSGSTSLGSILLLVGVFLGSILVGVVIIYALSKLRRKGKSVSDTIEALEQSIVKKDDDKPSTPTLTIAPPSKPSTPPPVIAQREEAREDIKPTPEKLPKVEEANAPSWLKSGLQTPAATQTPSAPAQASAPVTPPAPKPQAPIQQQKPAAVPPWLQNPATPAPAPAQPKPVTPPAAPAPVVQQPKVTPAAPVQSPAPAVVQPPKATPAPAVPVTPSAPKPAVTPPWLQQASPSAPQPVQAKPVTPAAPTPAPATPVQPPRPVAPATPPVQQAAVQPLKPVPTPAAAPATPPAPPVVTPPQAPVTPNVPSTNAVNQLQEQPIAFIRADSLGNTGSQPFPEGPANPR